MNVLFAGGVLQGDDTARSDPKVDDDLEAGDGGEIERDQRGSGHRHQGRVQDPRRRSAPGVHPRTGLTLETFFRSRPKIVSLFFSTVKFEIKKMFL